MQNNPNNPYDDIFSNISKIVEDIVKNMPEHQHARIIGYTIITRGSNEPPAVFRIGDGNDDDGDGIPYEIVETDDTIYITTEIPPDPRNKPVADIRVNSLRICVDDRETTIMLNHPVDVIHSWYRLHHGVLDITLKKVRNQ
jgi:HSP20 family molecular chaperone IbpA